MSHGQWLGVRGVDVVGQSAVVGGALNVDRGHRL